MTLTFNDPDAFVAKDFKRDQWGRPYIMQPNGKRIGYTRCSSAAKLVEDPYNLNRWDNRNIAFGMSYDASLVARILAIGGDPASWGKPEKDDVNEIVEAARGVAKAHKRADIGTAVHHLTHRVDRGEDVVGGPYQADLDAYTAAMAAAGLTRHPEWIECRMVNDDLQMAGTADRIVVTATGVHRIADIKTGATIDFGGLGWTAQEAAYAGGLLYDIDAEERLPTPTIDQEVGYIIHLPAGEGRCDIYEVDLVSGLAAARLANEIRATRKASKAWITPIKIAPVATDPPGSTVEQPAPESPPDSGAGTHSFVVPMDAVDGNGEPHPHAGCRIVNGECAEPPAVDAAAADPLDALRQRYRALNTGERARLMALEVDWKDQAAIEAAISAIENPTTHVGMKLKQMDAKPAAEAPPQTHKTAPAPRPQPPDEGADVSEADVEALKKRFADMSPAAKAWAGALPVQSNEGHCWRINEKATVRRYELYRGVFALAEWGVAE